MAIGKHKNILFFCFHMESRIMFHLFEIQCSKKVCASQAAPGVSTVYSMYHTYYITAYLRCNGFKIWHNFSILLNFLYLVGS